VAVPIRRVAIIYDDQVRPDTTGVYCRRALGRLVEVEHVLPSELGRVPRGRYDLFLNVDDGLRYRLPARLRPCAWWAIDTHLDPDWYLEKAPDFDFVFAAQRGGAELLRRAGVGSARWLPLACDPELHRRHEVEEVHDVCFVGHLFPGPRSELVRLIERRYPRSFVGRRFFEEMSRTYSASRIVFNRSIGDDVNMRVFEALACGSLLLTNDLHGSGQDELFRDGVHLATYRDPEEMLDKIAYYLARDDLRRRIAARGRELALAEHTYGHRMESILRAAEDRASSATVPAAGRVRAADPGLTSIVIPTRGQLEATRACLESIRRHTPEPHELIVVDNASADGTVGYLEAQPDVRLIANAENRGFPAAVNQGIRAATGRQVLLLNNDTVVTPGWLARLLRALYSDPLVGLAGPCSNRVSGPQQVPAEYDSFPALEAFAAARGEAHDGLVEGCDRLVGFCLLIRRELVDAIGLLDEGFGLGCFEDDDYCLRAIRAGFRAVIARDAFVHHEGSLTFRAEGVDFAGLMRENERRFLGKWSASPGPGQPAEPPEPYRVEVAPSGGLLLLRARVRLSLCMIVRDNEKTLPACLESIRPWVDEMVIVDTGSTDETPRIVEAYGGRLFHFPWCDDFSAARNESLRHARGEWVFWMDSDDTIPPECGRGLRELAMREADPGLLGYVMQVHCPGGAEDGDPAADVTEVDHVKLFRNRPDLRFDGRIHEQVLPAIRAAGGEVAWTDLFVVHSGSDPSAQAQERKRRRDLRILEKELSERPGHPFTLFNLGMTLVDGGRFTEAADYLRRSIAVSGDEESHLRKAYSLLVYAEMRLGRMQEALASCGRGRRLFPEDAELRFREGVLLHDLGRLDEAVRAYRDVLERRDGRHLSSVIRGLDGFKARQNLAVVLIDMGRLDEAEREWRAVVAEMPGYRPGWRGLVEMLLAAGRLEDAGAAAEDMDGDPALGPEGALQRSRVALALGSTNEARRWLDKALGEAPEDLEALRWAAQLLFEHGTADEAERALRRLIERLPEDASAHHNLGTVLLRSKRHGEAEESYRHALAHRPDHAATHLHLGYTLKEQGRLPEAEASWREVLRLAPGDVNAMAELRGTNPIDKPIPLSLPGH
jgi:GT2 family glycosyltransferase/tetratricopeptide (TPR) repeat protein